MKLQELHWKKHLGVFKKEKERWRNIAPISRFGKFIRVLMFNPEVIENNHILCEDGLENYIIAKSQLDRLKERIGERDFEIIVAYHQAKNNGFKITKKQIGKKFGISEARVSQIHSNARNALENM